MYNLPNITYASAHMGYQYLKNQLEKNRLLPNIHIKNNLS